MVTLNHSPVRSDPAVMGGTLVFRGSRVQLGLAGTPNGALLACLDGNHDVFVTADKNLRCQQNLRGRTLAIVALPTNRLPVLATMTAEIASAVSSATPGSSTIVAIPTAHQPEDQQP